MKQRPLLFRTIGFALVLGTIGAAFVEAQTSKVVFLRGNEVATANSTGTQVTVLTHDAIRKSNPVWSPDGTKIAYLVAASPSSTAIGSIAIISADGQPQNTVTIRTQEPDGTLIEGMRFPEEIGWYNNTAVFADGSANPQVAEYRAMVIGSGKEVASYLGYDFATCPTHAQVAYVSNEKSERGSPQIAINDHALYAAASAQSAFRELHWSSDCTRLGFFEDSDSSTSFVVLQGGQIESKTVLQGDGWDAASIADVPGGFVLLNSPNLNFYDIRAKSLTSNSEPLRAAQQQSANHASIVQKLDGHAASWWQSGP